MKLISVINEILNIGSKERIHVSKNPVQELRDLTTQNATSSEYRPIGKPDGFWYAFGDSWLYFAKDDMGKNYYEALQHAYKVYVNRYKIISILNQDMLDDFNNEFGLETDSRSIPYEIDWVKVTQQYSGFEIPCLNDIEVQNITRNRWLSLWDVPSGVIWNPNAVLKLKPLGNPKTLNTPRKTFNYI